MIRILHATLSSTMQCRPQYGLGKASVLFVFEGTYRFSGSKSVSEGIDSTIAGRLNPDQLTSSGRCRAILTPT
ncbi:hypothetical protein H6G89_20615 [Oscillatoria sp. FACHB-1407]|uniref:hypothetical protein n=1 Tax=Oscillatoria sp. FACHB-1407 TaxID=2692847 RepID=UPI001689CDCA|nr:hypothetical protein [Oscillatoria sp. FACHB-1407]MBD2463417.1 hypothetical protein [Oscillatoria sp. FACHB-1407]